MFSLNWILPCIYLCSSAPTYIVLYVPMRLICLFLPRQFFIYFDEKLWSVYQRSVIFCYETFMNTQIKFYGDYNYLWRSKENVLYISNHQSAVDWIISDLLACRQGGIGRLRYIIKEEIKYMPLYGWAFAEHGCIYVNRGNFHAPKAVEALEYLRHNNMGCWLVIFPEGTRVDTSNTKLLERSREFARSQDVEPLTHHLTPRLRGTELTLRHLGDYLDAVYDVTVLYSDIIDRSTGKRKRAPGMFDWFDRQRTIHIRLDRLPMSQVPKEGKELKKWMYERFQKKDAWMRAYLSASTDDNCLSQNPEDTGYVWKLPLHETLPSFAFFFVLNLLLWCSSMGRWLYIVTCTLGTIYGLCYVTLVV